MNVRMSELYDQSLIPGDGENRKDELDPEMFALLIVQECAEICAAVAAAREGYLDIDGRDTAYSCGEQIKEYFGVE